MNIPKKVFKYFENNNEKIISFKLLRKGCFSIVWLIKTLNNQYVLKIILKKSNINEIFITEEISNIWPGISPKLIRNWNRMFLQIYKSPKRKIEYRDTKKILKKYSELQKESSFAVEYFKNIGIPYYDLFTFEKEFGFWIQNDEYLKYQFRQEDLDFVIKKVKFLIEKILQFNIPNSLEHGDLHLENIVGIRDESLFIIDWSEVTITHPFFSLYYLFWNSRDLALEVKQSLTEAYLVTWSEFESIERLNELLKYTDQLGICFFAFRYFKLSKIITKIEKQSFISFYISQIENFISQNRVTL